MGFFDYLLAGGVGAAQGYEARQERLRQEEEERKKQDRQALLDALATAQAYQQLGFRPTGPVRTTSDPAARAITALEMPELPTMTPQAEAGILGRSLSRGLGVRPTTELTPFEATRQRAFTEANQRALGTMAPTTPLRSALTTAAVQPPTPTPAKKPLDDTRLRQFERAVGTQPAVPETQVEVPGMGRIGFDRPLTDDEKLAQRMREKEAELDLLEARRLLELGPSNRAIFGMLQKEGIFGPQVAYEDVQNLDLKPYFTDYLRDKSAASAYERAQMMAGAQARMGTFLPVVEPGGDQPTIAFGTRGGELVPTTFQAPGRQSPLSERAKKIQETTRPLSADDAAFVRSFMPTPKMDAKGNVVGYNPPQRRLPAAQALGSSAAGIVGGVIGEAMYMGTSPEAQRLSNIINQQADRRALAEQGGRLSDRDVTIKRAEVAIRGGDVNNDPVLYRKLNDVLSWAQTEQAPTPSATGQQSLPGGTTLEQEFPDKIAQIQAARARGVSDAAIRARIMRGR